MPDPFRVAYLLLIRAEKLSRAPIIDENKGIGVPLCFETYEAPARANTTDSVYLRPILDYKHVQRLRRFSRVPLTMVIVMLEEGSVEAQEKGEENEKASTHPASLG
jgi:hypothetical protein